MPCVHVQIYDEMVDELCEADGSDRLEFWKQIVLKREYTYNRTVPVKNADGTETHKTMSKLTHSHSYTHAKNCTDFVFVSCRAAHAARRDSLHVSPLSPSPGPAHIYTHVVSPGGCQPTVYRRSQRLRHWTLQLCGFACTTQSPKFDTMLESDTPARFDMLLHQRQIPANLHVVDLLRRQQRSAQLVPLRSGTVFAMPSRL